MKTNINKFFNDIQLHNFYENAFNVLIKYYNNELDIIQICDTILYNINSSDITTIAIIICFFFNFHIFFNY